MYKINYINMSDGFTESALGNEGEAPEANSTAKTHFTYLKLAQHCLIPVTEDHRADC